ncbi:putative carboxypeptidase [Colletotrichum orbiculare MAFF 240422]|uniref:Carboxypeptidase n=1 Tax=Colletotrichum orbiculare (strain 104-T / ATCC 96160 / CBS 514.97 / LARS 414 / MAFF 240422) TaxID=1213857 RepID=A0A484FHZ0_COLOR|nr:putative carboxypeptidase [Colletotrichum orbiculare MAFF 240422]
MMRTFASLTILAALPFASGLAASPFDEQVPLGSSVSQGRDDDALACNLPPVLEPRDDGLPSGKSVFSGTAALERQVRRHQAVIRVPSVCYDDLGDFETDERWLPFHRLHDVLRETYPVLHKRSSLAKVNTFGLVYTLNGTDPALKPALLTAHQDVVPVADASSWTHPPFDGVFDGTWIWGRGAADDKASLTAILSAAETLLSNRSWAPRRTLVFAFGFDEECSGVRGAGYIAEHLLALHGAGGFALVLDEGSAGLQVVDAARYALVGVQEKGQLNVEFGLRVRGGHSSNPPAHTGIGVAADIVAALEAHAYEPRVTPASPAYGPLACQLAHSPASEPALFERLRAGDLDGLAAGLAARDAGSRILITSAAAADTIRGGVKINALPEAVTLGVNFRIAPQDTVAGMQRGILEDIRGVVAKHGLQVVAFQGDEGFEASGHGLSAGGEADWNGTLTLTAKEREKFPATPVSPTSGPAWDVLAGTIRHSMGDEGKLVVPVGEMVMGNTDTRHYLDLSQNIYRWLPVFPGDMQDFHATNERFRAEADLRMAAFYYDLIRNLDAADLE